MSEVEKTRYSDEELAEFKAIILDKLEKAKADYELLRSSITHTSDSSNSYSISKRLSCVSRTRPTEYAAKRAN